MEKCAFRCDLYVRLKHEHSLCIICVSTIMIFTYSVYTNVYVMAGTTIMGVGRGGGGVWVGVGVVCGCAGKRCVLF